MRHSLGEHRFAGTRGTVKEHASGRVDADLSVQVKVRQGQLDSLANLLLLHVHASDVAVLYVRSLGIAQQEMDESASGGRMSTSALEWRWSATDDEGLSSSRFRVERMRT